MTDKTDSKEREAFEAHYRQLGANEATLSRWVDDGVIPPAMVGKYIIRIVQDAWLAFQAGRASVHIDLEDMATASAQGFRDGVASLAASAGSEPVPFGHWFTDDPKAFATPGSGFLVGKEPPKNAINVIPLYTHPSPPEGMVMVPANPEEVRAFIGSQFERLQYGKENGVPHENDRYTLTSHDLLSAFRWWAENMQLTPPTTSAGSGKGE